MTTKQLQKLERVWRAFDNGENRTLAQFTNRVLATQKANDITFTQALKKVTNTIAYTSPAERSRNNFLESLKTRHNDVYNEMKVRMRKEHGHFSSIADIKSKMTWDDNRKGYVFEGIKGSFFIDVSNSPEEATIHDISN